MASDWERVLAGIAAVVILFLFYPGVKRALAQSRKAEKGDWPAVLWPLLLVVVFVWLLIQLV